MKVIKDVGQVSVPINQIHIIDELKFYNAYRSREERQLLTDQIRLEGIIRDAIVIWKFEGKNVCVEGFTRHEIALELNEEARAKELPIPFPSLKAHVMEFESMDEAKFWITINQNSRRNLTDVQRTFQMGQLYNSLSTKSQVVAYLKARGEAPGAADDEKIAKDENVRSVLLSGHFNVNEKTVRRAAVYASGIERIRQGNGEIATRILRGEKVDNIDFNQKVVMAIGSMEPKEFRQLKWKDAASLTSAMKVNRSEEVQEKTITDSKKVKLALDEFLSSPTPESLKAVEKLMKEYLTKAEARPMRVAS